MTAIGIERTFGAQSMTAPLREVLVKRPGGAFGRAFDDPAADTAATATRAGSRAGRSAAANPAGT